jgi:hypothetical protein
MVEFELDQLPGNHTDRLVEAYALTGLQKY